MALYGSAEYGSGLYGVAPALLSGRAYAFIRDGFQRGDSAALGHADTDDIWAFMGGSQIGTTGQKAAINTAANYGLAYIASAARDGLIITIPQDFTSGRKVMAISFRIQDASNFWFVANLTSAGAQSDTKVSIWKRVAGVDANVGGDATHDWSTPGLNFQLDMFGSAIKLWIARDSAAETPLISIIDSAFWTATRHGIGTFTNSNNTWQYWWFFEQPARSTADPPIINVDLGVGTASKISLVDVTKKLRVADGIVIRRGMPTEIDHTQAGTVELTLDNRDRRFDPFFEGDVRNLIQNPSFETNTTGYTAVASAISRVANGGFFGAYTLRIDLTNAANSGLYTTTIPVSPSTGYTFSVSGVTGPAGPFTFKFLIDWYNAAFGLISTSTSNSKSFNGTTIRRLDYSNTAPALAAYAVVQVLTDAAQGVFDAYFDGFQLEVSGSVGGYVDGDQPNCHWTGTAHASTSIYGAPYFPNIKPVRTLVVRAFHDGQNPELIRAYTESYDQAYPGKVDAVARIRAADGIKQMAYRQLTASRSRELISTRVAYFLSLIPDITGLTDVSVTTLYARDAYHFNSSALQGIQEMAVTEGGRFFLDRTGLAVFLSHAAELASPYNTSQATFGDGGGAELPYSNLVITLNDAHIYNDVRVQRFGGTEQTASDATSQTAYGVRTLSRQTIGDTDADSTVMCTWLLARHKDPRARITQLDFSPYRDSRLWKQALIRDLVDRVTVRRRPLVVSSMIEEAVQIIWIELRINGVGRWDVSWRLAPVYTS